LAALRALSLSGGEAVVRTVAHGVQPWGFELERKSEPASAGERAGRARPFSRPLKRAHEVCTHPKPQLKLGSTVLNDGFAADQTRRAQSTDNRQRTLRVQFLDNLALGRETALIPLREDYFLIDRHDEDAAASADDFAVDAGLSFDRSRQTGGSG